MYRINEYEICFKCHASPQRPIRIAAHPAGHRRNATRAWSFRRTTPRFIPSRAPERAAMCRACILPLTTSSMIYCTDCHSDESVANGGTGSRGPHGSKYAPILRDQYDTTINVVPYSNSNFALCYNCHYESSILSDVTFQKKDLQWGGHSGHVADHNGCEQRYPFCLCLLLGLPRSARDTGQRRVGVAQTPDQLRYPHRKRHARIGIQHSDLCRFGKPFGKLRSCLS